MGYVIDDSNLDWAKKRVNQLRDAEYEIGSAIEDLQRVPKGLCQGALQMGDQPETHVMISFADDLTRTMNLLKERFDRMQKDRKSLEREIQKYERREENDQPA